MFVLTIDPLIKTMKRRLGKQVEVLDYMDDLKVSMTNIQTAQLFHDIVKRGRNVHVNYT